MRKILRRVARTSQSLSKGECEPEIGATRIDCLNVGSWVIKSVYGNFECNPNIAGRAAPQGAQWRLSGVLMVNACGCSTRERCHAHMLIQLCDTRKICCSTRKRT